MKPAPTKLALYPENAQARLMAQTAEFFVVDQLVDRRLVSAYRAIGIALQLERMDLHGECVEAEQAADQSVAFAEDDFDRFQSFYHPD